MNAIKFSRKNNRTVPATIGIFVLLMSALILSLSATKKSAQAPQNLERDSASLSQDSKKSDSIDEVKKTIPDDFKYKKLVYPNANLKNNLISTHNGDNAEYTSYTLVLKTKDSINQVLDFYKNSLNEGIWITTKITQNDDGGLILANQDGDKVKCSIFIETDSKKNELQIILQFTEK